MSYKATFFSLDIKKPRNLN